jgi:hypothetical protein
VAHVLELYAVSQHPIYAPCVTAHLITCFATVHALAMGSGSHPLRMRRYACNCLSQSWHFIPLNQQRIRGRTLFNNCKYDRYVALRKGKKTRSFVLSPWSKVHLEKPIGLSYIWFRFPLTEEFDFVLFYPVLRLLTLVGWDLCRR